MPLNSRDFHDTDPPDFHDTPSRICIEVTKITRLNFRDVQDLLSPDVEEDIWKKKLLQICRAIKSNLVQ